MKAAKYKVLISTMFIAIFFVKVSVAIAPVFLMLNNKAVTALITQLESESKDEKDNTEKDAFKDKKIFDEDKDMVIHTHCYTLTPFLIETNILHNLEHALFVQTYHPTVPTPPPNA